MKTAVINLVKKILVFLLCTFFIRNNFLVNSGASTAGANILEPATRLASSLQINYNRLADSFHWLDQVSESCLSFFQITDFKTYWISRWGLSEQDLSLLKQYQAIRKRYQNESLLDEYLSSIAFAPDPMEIHDPIADAFYTSTTLTDALKKLNDLLAVEERIFIKNFFEYFESRLAKVTWINFCNSSLILETLNIHLNDAKVSKYLYKMQNFYKSKPMNLRSVLVFSAPDDHLSAACYGDHLHLRLSNKLELDKDNNDILITSILIHEVTHHISGNANQMEKVHLSSVFLENSGKPNEIPLMDLEEPLVIAAQMYFIKNNFPEAWEKAFRWFFFPLAESYFSILEDYLASKKQIDENFIITCSAIHKSLSENKKRS